MCCRVTSLLSLGASTALSLVGRATGMEPFLFASRFSSQRMVMEADRRDIRMEIASVMIFQVEVDVLQCKWSPATFSNIPYGQFMHGPALITLAGKTRGIYCIYV